MIQVKIVTGMICTLYVSINVLIVSQVIVFDCNETLPSFKKIEKTDPSSSFFDDH